MKKVENMPMMIRPRITLEPVSVRSRRMRSGMIGLESRDSRRRKPAKSAMAMPPTMKVWAETQPSVEAVTMA